MIHQEKHIVSSQGLPREYDIEKNSLYSEIHFDIRKLRNK